MLQFKDLEFKPHNMSIAAQKAINKAPELEELFKNQLNCTQAVITFNNGITLSVIFGEMFYSNGVDTYECMNITHKSKPLGNLKENQVSEYMSLLQQIDLCKSQE